MSAAVDVDVTTGTSDIEKVFVDGNPVYGSVDVRLDQVDPSGVVYQPFKDGAALNDILKVDTVFLRCMCAFLRCQSNGFFHGDSHW